MAPLIPLALCEYGDHGRYGLTQAFIRRLSPAQGQCDLYRHEHPAAGLVEAPPNSPQPWADAMSHAGDQYLGSYFDCCERSRHDDELDEEASSRVEELRKKRSEKEKTLGIGQR